MFLVLVRELNLLFKSLLICKLCLKQHNVSEQDLRSRQTRALSRRETLKYMSIREITQDSISDRLVISLNSSLMFRSNVKTSCSI